jgi:hypothetical protein
VGGGHRTARARGRARIELLSGKSCKRAHQEHLVRGDPHRRRRSSPRTWRTRQGHIAC